MSSGIPWLMDRLHALLSHDYNEEDWRNVLQECDPRKTFAAELCDKCYARATAMRCGDGVHVISNDEVAVSELMLFLHDGTCQCADTPKTRFETCLLDAVAAFGTVTALRSCLRYFQNHTSWSPVRNRDNFNISEKDSCLRNYLMSDSETNLSHKPVESTIKTLCEITETCALEEFCTASPQSGVTSDSTFPPQSLVHKSGHRLLLSPNCDGGYSERQQFPGNSSAVLKCSIQDHHVESVESSHALHCSPECGLHLSGEMPGSISDDKIEKQRNNNSSQNRTHLENRAYSNVAQENHSSQFVQQSYSCLPSARPGSEVPGLSQNDTHAINEQSTTSVQASSTRARCQVPLEEGDHCPLTCCFPRAEVDCLREHVDQTTLLSMSIQALHYNQGSMMVCARALNVASISHLVRLSGKMLITDALLYLYFISIEEKEKFYGVSLDDLFILHERTLSLEVSRLCRLAWSDVSLTDLFYRARHTTVHIEVCEECEAAQFPDLKLYEKTAYVKFRRGFHDNAGLLDYIENGGCPCATGPTYPVRKRKQRLAVIPEMAAAASGNSAMLRALTEPWLTSEMAINRQCNTGDGRPRKSCTKSPGSARRSGISVDFLHEVEHLGITKIGALLRHSLYGGYDDIVDYILSKMSYWSLSLDETMACLHMCVLMRRDDLFFRLSVLAESVHKNGVLASKAYLTATPLMIAVTSGRTLLVNMLLARGANPLVENWDGITAIQLALQSDFEDSEMIALRMMTVSPCPLLHKRLIAQALLHDKLNVVKYLIGCGVRTTYYTYTQLGPSYSERETEIPLLQWRLNSITSTLHAQLPFLLSQGLDVNTVCSNKRDSKGDTLLHLAVNRDIEPELLEMLISHGARVNAGAANCRTPLFYALHRNHLRLFACLIKAGARVSNPHKFFHFALVKRLFQVVLFLLHAGYRPTPNNLASLAELGARVPEPVQLLISSVRSEPSPLTVLCAMSLREGLGDQLYPYLDAVRCPDIVRRFIQMKHLLDRFLDPASWRGMLQWNVPLMGFPQSPT